MTEILLVRHGESEANRLDLFAGHFDAELTEQGHIQAKKTAEYIAENYKVDKVYASDLKRAFKTGKAIADRLGLDISKTESLREIYAGKWEGVDFQKLRVLFAEDFDRWVNDIGNAYCTDGESVRALGERIMNSITNIAKENPGKTVVVATHATPIRVFLTLVRYGDVSETNNTPWVSNASVSVINYEGGSWTVAEENHDSHLGDLITFLPDDV